MCKACVVCLLAFFLVMMAADRDTCPDRIWGDNSWSFTLAWHCRLAFCSCQASSSRSSFFFDIYLILSCHVLS